MSCTNPVGCHRQDGSPTKRPCGVCLDCRLDYARQWALRCVNEASMHDENCFITLTYNDKHLPPGGSISKGELSKFMKRLRSEIPKPVRFFGCGEYGKQYKRPHYHLCLFGFDFPDKEIFSTENRRKGNPDFLYISPMLGKVWEKGFHTVAELNYKTAGYVARYIKKKHMGKGSNFVYNGLEPEFALMSRGNKKDGNGGIGKKWFMEYWQDMYPKDYFMLDGKRHKPPKYYDSLMDRYHPKVMAWVRAKREFEVFKSIPEPDKRLVEKDKYRQQVTRRLERKLEL